MIMVSACLAGINCKYDGGNNLIPWIRDLVADGKAIPVCPEQLGGLPTPREPAEIAGGFGGDILEGKARVTTCSGEDVSAAFLRGAVEVLNLARLVGAACAILKERSPSCGSGWIYDGSFTHTPVPGQGVTAALLKENGIPVYSEETVSEEIIGRLLKGRLK